jgi:diacylglycerol O-acyltransferase
VREIALPSSSSDAVLAEQTARLHACPLDRSRPLWEMYLITGVRDGRVAIYTKVHHAAIDGVPGADILATMLDLTPEVGRISAPPTRAARATLDLLRVSAHRRWSFTRRRNLGRQGSQDSCRRHRQ